MKCSVDGCVRLAKWRGLCQPHYIQDQYREKPHPTRDELAIRVFAKVEKTDTCWLWTGARHKRYGHGMFGYNALGKSFTIYAHRWVYEHLVGPIPDGLTIDHLCRVTNCVNPAHLEPVTSVENTMRSEGVTATRARQTHCHRGHPLAGENLRVSKLGHRQCRTCGGWTGLLVGE